MFLVHTPPHNNDVILNNMQSADGIVRVVFATVALGMWVNFVGLNRVIHLLMTTSKKVEEWVDQGSLQHQPFIGSHQMLVYC